MKIESLHLILNHSAKPWYLLKGFKYIEPCVPTDLIWYFKLRYREDLCQYEWRLFYKNSTTSSNYYLEERDLKKYLGVGVNEAYLPKQEK